jgi:phage shock protein PspC (stress-responsive transcriptional regulator)
MSDNQESLNILLQKLEALQKKQAGFNEEINDLREEITRLKTLETPAASVPKTPISSMASERTIPSSSPARPSRLYRDPKNKILGGVCAGFAKYVGMNIVLVRFLWVLLCLLFCIGILVYVLLWLVIPAHEYTAGVSSKTSEDIPKEVLKNEVEAEDKAKKKTPFDLEKYIGENLISKIGIAVLIIGVVIGTKYSIDNNLISPLVRIVLGYLVGVSLFGLGMKLKKKYENFSAVLVSGSMAILYFMTYAAYAFYDLIPQLLAFMLMVFFTVVAVYVALNYNRQIIAHIGLVGAYSIPFLLSEGSGEALILFSYMAIINSGILFIAFKKYWKPLYLVSFFVTWLIFVSWYFSKYESEEYFILALIFLAVFFVIFYLTFLAYKIFKNESFEILDIFMLLANSFVFYGLGYSVINSQPNGASYLGLFTFINAVLHLLVSLVIYRQKLADKNIFYLVSGLVLVFLTIAIPVQLDGNWVTLLWVGEATLLFWIGRTKKVPIYEKIAYPLILLSFFSLTQDWNQAGVSTSLIGSSERFTPIFNSGFLTSFLCIVLFGYINLLHYSKKYSSPWTAQQDFMNAVSYGISGIFLIALYSTFATEISNYWDQLYKDSMINTADDGSFANTVYNYDLKRFKTIWLINYSILFATLLSFANIQIFKNRRLYLVNMAFNALGLFVFLTVGLYELSELRDRYLDQGMPEYYEIGTYYIWIRYISYLFVAALLVASHKLLKLEFYTFEAKIPFDILLYGSLWLIASSELINWLALSGSEGAYKLGLTIFWGVYALALIVRGIWKNKKHLRIAAIVLFSVTLIKLFVYDLSDLSTLSKAIVFLALGILLLTISFLYNKYKRLLWDDD